ncbi:hypothetical protein LVJ94_09525 [Pendulispora rubella]|uniref:Uncharacterized protein n=1 Tax=Pendulispora rubella TaxID=2741070 RepID=A0ABZ2L9B3_9BACT
MTSRHGIMMAIAAVFHLTACTHTDTDEHVNSVSSPITFVGGCDGDPNKDCTTPRNMKDYWPSPPVGTFILTSYLNQDGTRCAKRTRYRVGTHAAGTSYMFDEYDCIGEETKWLTTWYYMFGPNDVSEWRDDAIDVKTKQCIFKSFEADKGITWGGMLTPGVWSGKQTHCVDGACGTVDAWGWSQSRLNYTLKDLTVNGTTYHYVAYIANQQVNCADPECNTTSDPINGGYYLVPATGSGGYGGFVRQEYYDKDWNLCDHHDADATCVTTDFDQVDCRTRVTTTHACMGPSLATTETTTPTSAACTKSLRNAESSYPKYRPRDSSSL